MAIVRRFGVLLLCIGLVGFVTSSSLAPVSARLESEGQGVKELADKVRQLEAAFQELKDAQAIQVTLTQQKLDRMTTAAGELERRMDEMRRRQLEDGLVLNVHEKSLTALKESLTKCCGKTKTSSDTP